MNFSLILPYIQIILSVILIGGILIQHSEAGMGGAFGGGDGFSSGNHSKRGAEKIIFIGTIITAILFASASFIILLIK
jgi:protein translocase SecG subunit